MENDDVLKVTQQHDIGFTGTLNCQVICTTV